MLIMNPQPHIPAKPQEWDVVHFHQSCQHPRDAIILCQSAGPVHDEEFREFVVWYANMVEGGCHNGFYTYDYDKARRNYAERIGSMN